MIWTILVLLLFLGPIQSQDCTLVSCTPGRISGWARENKSLFIFPLGMTPFIVNKVFFCSQSKPTVFTSSQPKPYYPPFLSSSSLSFLGISHHRLCCSHCISAPTAEPLLRGISQDILAGREPQGFLSPAPQSIITHTQPKSLTLGISAPSSHQLSWWIFSVQPKNS